MLKLRAKISNLRVHLQHFHRIRFKYQAARSLVANHSCWPRLCVYYPRFCFCFVTLKPLVANDSYMQQEGTELCASLLACALLSSCSLSHGLLVKPRPVGTPHTQCPHQMLHAYLLPLSYSRQFSVLWVDSSAQRCPSHGRAAQRCAGTTQPHSKLLRAKISFLCSVWSWGSDMGSFSFSCAQRKPLQAWWSLWEKAVLG